MSEKARKRYEKKSSKTVPDQQIREPVYDFTKPEDQVKDVGLRDREDSGIEVNDYPNESSVKENTSTKKNDEVKLRITSDKEC
jgi:hypothetical protein